MCSSFMTILRNTPALIARFPSCCAVRRAAKLFPGDIFYIHSRMLERSTHLIKERGGGSLTALPVIETTAQDISAYIPTNLISITDGQIYLSPTLFQLGILPAVDVGKSVSRVGGAAQRPAYRSVAGHLKLDYAQFAELETFAKFGTRLDESTRKIIDHGQHIRACLKQAESRPVSMVDQITVLLALTTGLFDRVPIDKVMEAEKALHQGDREYSGRPCESIDIRRKIKRRGPQGDSRSRHPDAASVPARAPNQTRTKVRI
jgi:F-type H+-transporting ATPase subunit alpha